MKIPNQSAGTRHAGFKSNISKLASKPYSAIHAAAINKNNVMGFKFNQGFLNRGNVFALDPRPSECTECVWTCSVESCGPGCRREVCFDSCTSVPC